MPKGSNQRNRSLGSGSRGEEIRAFASGVTADRPECSRCTWVPRGKRWALKFVNRSCSEHRSLL